MRPETLVSGQHAVQRPNGCMRPEILVFRQCRILALLRTLVPRTRFLTGAAVLVSGLHIVPCPNGCMRPETLVSGLHIVPCPNGGMRPETLVSGLRNASMSIVRSLQ